MGGRWVRDIEIIGTKIHHLTVVSIFRKKQGKATVRILHCLCDCGAYKDTRVDTFLSGNIVSCGCIDCHKTKHGHARNNEKNRTYCSWQSMVDRCGNSKNPKYYRYGGRGVSVCVNWCGEFGFVNFLNDMGERPPNKTLDRIDNDKGYCKENCRWATKKEQMRNRENTLYINYHGENVSIAELAERFGLYNSLVAQRIKKGWDIDKVCTEEIKKPTTYTYMDKEYTIKELSALTSVISESGLRKRLLAGWDVEKALIKVSRVKSKEQ